MPHTDQTIRTDEVAQLFINSANFYQGQAIALADQVRSIRAERDALAARLEAIGADNNKRHAPDSDGGST